MCNRCAINQKDRPFKWASALQTHARIVTVFFLFLIVCCLRCPFEYAGFSAVSQAVWVSFGLVSLFCALSDLPLNDMCSFRPPRALPQSRANQITEDYCQSALCCRGLIYIGKTRQGKGAIIENGFMRDPSWIKESASHNVALLCFVQVPGYEDCTDIERVEGPGRSLWISIWES